MPVSPRSVTRRYFPAGKAPSLRARYVNGASSTRVNTDDLELLRPQQAITNHLLRPGAWARSTALKRSSASTVDDAITSPKCSQTRNCGLSCDHPALSAFVKGFGCRRVRDGSDAAVGPAFESLQGRTPRDGEAPATLLQLMGISPGG